MKSASAPELAPDLSGLSIKVGFEDVGVTEGGGDFAGRTAFFVVYSGLWVNNVKKIFLIHREYCSTVYRAITFR